MSYNSEPEWTKNITFPPFDELTCPYCGEVPNNAEEIVNVMKEGSYYSPRHIPKKLVFTCDNPECPKCDEDYTFVLSVVVRAEYE